MVLPDGSPSDAYAVDGISTRSRYDFNSLWKAYQGLLVSALLLARENKQWEATVFFYLPFGVDRVWKDLGLDEKADSSA